MILRKNLTYSKIVNKVFSYSKFVRFDHPIIKLYVAHKMDSGSRIKVKLLNLWAEAPFVLSIENVSVMRLEYFHILNMVN